jgi:hypothetical protein
MFGVCSDARPVIPATLAFPVAALLSVHEFIGFFIFEFYFADNAERREII